MWLKSKKSICIMKNYKLLTFKTLFGILTFLKYWYNTGLISDKVAYSQQKGEK